MCALAVVTGGDHKTLERGDLAPGFQAGRYQVRFALTAEEITAAQRLRYRTLFLEHDGEISAEMARTGRDADELDEIAQHVIVLDSKPRDRPVVGTLRLVSDERLRQGQSFYTEQAFDVGSLRKRYARVLELSRFCIDDRGRSGSILMLIWKFTMQFIIARGFDVMIGCASFQGTDVNRHRAILSYLYRNNLAPVDLQAKPIVAQHVALKSLIDDNADWEEARHSVPTLLRGYLKIGAKISDCAIIDPVFNTTFVCIYVDARNMILNNHRLVRPQHG